MVILRSAEHPMWDQPTPVRVVKVCRGEGRRLREYALVELSGKSAEPATTVVMTRRTGRRWRAPRPGERMEILLWEVGDPDAAFAAERFRRPERGASICYLVEDTLDNQVSAWSERREGGWGGGS